MNRAQIKQGALAHHPHLSCVSLELIRLSQTARTAYDAFEKDCDTYSDDVLAKEQGRELTKADDLKYRALRKATAKATRAVLSYPAATPAEALFKIEFTDEILQDDPEDLAAQINAAKADLARLAEAGQ